MQERLYKTQAVVLRRYDFGEADKRLIVFTPGDGKVSLLAKGIKRATSKMAGHLEPMTLTHLVAARGRNMDTVTQAQTVESFARARQEPERVYFGLLMLELLDKLTMEQQENKALWYLLVESLRRVDSDEDPWTAAAYFQSRALVLSGYEPQLSECVECAGSLDPVRLLHSPRAGGLLCHDCRLVDPGGTPISASAVKVLRAATGPHYPAFRRIRIAPKLRHELDSLLRSSFDRLLDVRISSVELLQASERAASRSTGS